MADTATATDTGTTFDPKTVAKSLGLTINADHSADIAALAQRALKLQAEADKKITPMIEEEERTLKKGEAASDAAFKQIQPFKPTPPPDQRQYQTDPLQSFFSLGSVVGILANAFEHQPWSNSFEAAAAAIDARNRGDAEAYRNAFDQWKANTDMLFKRHEVAMQDWQALNDKTKGDMAARDGLIRAWQAKYGADTDRALRAAGLYQQADDAMLKKNDAIMKMIQLKPTLEAYGEVNAANLEINEAAKQNDPIKMQKAKKDYADALSRLQELVSAEKGTTLAGLPPIAKEAVLAGQNPTTAAAIDVAIKTGGTGPTDPGIVAMSKTPSIIAGAHYDTALASSWNAGTPAARASISAARLVNPEYSQLKVNQKNTFLSSKWPSLEETVRRGNNVVQHIQVLNEAAAELENGNLRAGNTLLNSLGLQIGSGAGAGMKAIGPLVAKELVSFLVKSGGGEAERMQEASDVDWSQTPAALHSVISKWLDVMAGQFNSIRNEYVQSTGLSDFDNNLLPETKSVMENHGYQPAVYATNPRFGEGWDMIKGYGLTPYQQQALDWANAHKSDPRASQILKSLGR